MSGEGFWTAAIEIEACYILHDSSGRLHSKLGVRRADLINEVGFLNRMGGEKSLRLPDIAYDTCGS